MARRAQLFVATHAGALSRADALDGGQPPQSDAPHADLGGFGPLDLELLGEVAAAAVQYGHGDVEPVEVDLDHELLFHLPSFWCEVMVELGRSEDPELPRDVADAWAASPERDPSETDLLPVVRAMIAVATAAELAGRGVYLWVEDL